MIFAFAVLNFLSVSIFEMFYFQVLHSAAAARPPQAQAPPQLQHSHNEALYVRFYSKRFIAGLYCRLKRIKELEERLKEKEAQLNEKDAQLEEKDNEICELSAVVVANELVCVAPAHIDDFRIGTIAFGNI